MRTLTLSLLTVLFVTAAPPALRARVRAQNQPSSPGALPCELTAEDYAVYSAILDDLGTPEDPEEEWRRSPDFILADRTTVDTFSDYDPTWGFRSNSKQAPSSQTVADFKARLKKSCAIRPLFKAKISPHLVSNDEISKLFEQKGDGWKGFYQRYPKSSGTWNLSSVGYSNDGLEALVFVRHGCGGKCGTGHLVLLAKEHGTWVVKNRTMLWIS
jgi:hypothetical protein